MKILITGAAGFLGRHLCSRLTARGDEVRGLDLRLSPPVPGITPITGSVEDPSAVENAISGCEAVIHTAAMTGLWSRDEAAFDRVNVGGTRNVLDAAGAAGIARMVHVSSFVTLISGKRGPIREVDETHELPVEEMLGPYPTSKRRAELACRRHAVDPVIVMPPAPVGPGDHGPTPPGRMLADLAMGKLPALIDCTWNFVSVKALADGVIAALDRGKPGRRYLLTGDNMDTDGLTAMLTRLGLTPPRARVPHGVALLAGHVEGAVSTLTGKPPKGPLTGIRLAGPRLAFQNKRAIEELGFAPGDTEAAFREALVWMRAEGVISG